MFYRFIVDSLHNNNDKNIKTQNSNNICGVVGHKLIKFINKYYIKYMYKIKRKYK